MGKCLFFRNFATDYGSNLSPSLYARRLLWHLLSVACALYLFWIKSIIIALVLIAVVVVMMERVLHSEYIVGDGLLRIYRGRFGKSQSIKLEDIVRCTVKRSNFGLSHFLLLETVKGEFVLVEPENEEAFIKAIKK